MKLLNTAALTAVILASGLTTATAHENDKDAPHAMGHAPIGVMGDHRHKKGERMTSYRFMRMDMDGNRDGTDSLTADEIATTVPNRFFGTPGQPPTLRVVPTNMTMDMHMVGAMYGLSDRVTLMGMTSYKRNEMDHLTYRGGMGNIVRGEFTTVSKGFGDSSVTAIIGLAYEPAYWLSFSSRVKMVSQGSTKGLDPAIAAPVQTANPNNHGGETIEMVFGVNLAGQNGALKGHRLAFEVALPLYRDLNGPQLETDSVFTLGWQKAF